jgi:hypothetical protein
MDNLLYSEPQLFNTIRLAKSVEVNIDEGEKQILLSIVDR